MVLELAYNRLKANAWTLHTYMKLHFDAAYRGLQRSASAHQLTSIPISFVEIDQYANSVHASWLAPSSQLPKTNKHLGHDQD
jgi:hypothetical protein